MLKRRVVKECHNQDDTIDKRVTSRCFGEVESMSTRAGNTLASDLDRTERPSLTR